MRYIQSTLLNITSFANDTLPWETRNLNERRKKKLNNGRACNLLRHQSRGEGPWYPKKESPGLCSIGERTGRRLCHQVRIDGSPSTEGAASGCPLAASSDEPYFLYISKRCLWPHDSSTGAMSLGQEKKNNENFRCSNLQQD